MKSAAKKLPSKAPTKPAPKQARGLGRGLSALLSDSYSQIEESPATRADNENNAPERTLPLNKLHSGKYQPRNFFDDGALSELADSIRRNGIMQPILVRADGTDSYEIIAGERRWRAARLAGLTEIPVLIRELDDKQALELALVENIQREGLHPLEEAEGYQRLMNEFSYTQLELSESVHKSRSHIANLLRLLSLPENIRGLFATNKLSMGHARALMGMEEHKALALAHEIIENDLSVRQTEKLARDERNPSAENTNYGHTENARASALPKPRANMTPTASVPLMQAPAQAIENTRDKDPDILALEETLSENLGLKVSINDRGQSGQIMIAYDSLEQLDEILRRLGGSV